MIEDVTNLCAKFQDSMNKKLDEARESYIESLQMTIKHEIFTRVKTCMMIINNISPKLVSIQE